MAWAYPVPAAKTRPLKNSFRRTGYSRRRNGYHWAIDIPWSKGSRVNAIRRAKVVAVGNVWGSAYGKQVLLRWTTATGYRYAFYAHLNTISVQQGQIVSKGQRIGSLGETGNTSGPHVHFEYGWSSRWDMKRWNPYKHLERARCVLIGCR